jgi:hypothetical protein
MDGMDEREMFEKLCASIRVVGLGIASLSYAIAMRAAIEAKDRDGYEEFKKQAMFAGKKTTWQNAVLNGDVYPAKKHDL